MIKKTLRLCVEKKGLKIYRNILFYKADKIREGAFLQVFIFVVKKKSAIDKLGRET